MKAWLERSLMSLVNIWFALLPQRRPSRQALLDCKIISHRGEHDNRRVLENTLAAFSAPAEAGCWGLEFDVRWTKDLQPMVVHDTDAQRVFGIDVVIAEVTSTELRQRIPEIPTLQEVVECFGGRQHLMVELKCDELGAIAERSARLADVFAALAPVADYHFLALQPDLFELVEFAGDSACLPVGEFNVREMSAVAMARGFGGVCGQFLLLSDRLVERHHGHGQQLGSGFAASRNSLYRELNRGVDWIFTNHALRLQAIRQQALRKQQDSRAP